MAKISATERELWVLFQLIDPMNHQSKADRRKWERIFDALKLEDIADKIRVYAPGVAIDDRIFDAVTELEFETTSDQRDSLIELLERPGITTRGGRLMRRFEREIIKSRDGDAAAAS